jgi:hypothetical protein
MSQFPRIYALEVEYAYTGLVGFDAGFVKLDAQSGCCSTSMSLNSMV